MSLLNNSQPLLERVQKAIFEQLSKYEVKLALQVREKEEEAQKEQKRREDVGVELYTLQQHLARLQATFEGAEENYGIIKSLREDAERALKHSKSDYEKEQDKVKTHTKNCKLDPLISSGTTSRRIGKDCKKFKASGFI
jgi:hypothetical protein